MKQLYYTILFTVLICGAILVPSACEDDPVSINGIPIFDSNSYTFMVSEDALAGATIGTVSATDPEGNTVTYSLSGSTDFTIDVSSGMITLASGITLDFEVTSSYSLMVTVNDGNDATGEASVTIDVTNVNEAPVFANTPYAFSVEEGSTSGNVGMVSATDPDTDQAFNTLAYSITSTQTDFDIDPSSGAITVAASAALDFETTPSYTLTVTVSDGANAVTATVTINVTDVNEAPAFVFANAADTDYSFMVSVDANDGDVVGMISATDADTGDLLTYTLTAASTDFEIVGGTDVASGEKVSITVKAGASLSAGDVTLMVMVSDEGTPALTATASVEITINPVGVSNTAPEFVFANAADTEYSFMVSADADEGDVVGMISATDADTGDLLTYTLTAASTDFAIVGGTDVASGEKVSIEVKAGASLSAGDVTLMVMVSDGEDTDMADVNITITSTGVTTVDYLGSNTLIDISTAEQLNAIRWDLDGNGQVDDARNAAVSMYADAFPNSAGFSDTPTGYELVKNLDFGNADSYAAPTVNTAWTTGTGWTPIGDLTSPFNTTFDGNGYTISNLFINSTGLSAYGLFGTAGSQAVIGNIGLLGVDITTDNTTGSLVGDNQGHIRACYAIGTLNSSGSHVGGLVGRSGGSVINVNAAISACYAMVNVTGTGTDASGGVGGLVGLNDIGFSGMAVIRACYATGNVIGRNNTGGLVGKNNTLNAQINYSYAIGVVAGSGTGGLVGNNDRGGIVTESYFEGEGLGGMSASALQMPMDYAGIYENWDVDIDGDSNTDDPWDFGGMTDYPTLQIGLNKIGEQNITTPANQAPLFNPITYNESGMLVPVTYNFYINADANDGDPVFKMIDSAPNISAIDRETSNLEYSIVTPALADREFVMDMGTGAITLKTGASLGAEDTEYSLSIQVTDNDTRGALAASATVNIRVLGSAVDYLGGNTLIDITTLDQLNAIRWDLDGNGQVDDASNAPMYVAAFPNPADFSDTPTGYELMNNLDFDATTSYANGNVDKGWSSTESGSPIGWVSIGTTRFMEDFRSTFDGNGYTISNLYISSTGRSVYGLFAQTSGSAIIRNVGLANINITTDNTTGALVGSNEGAAMIIACYATGTVTSSGPQVGGLVGQNGSGGFSSPMSPIRPVIKTCYARVNVTATGTLSSMSRGGAGGLVGYNLGTGSSITACYATGNVAGSIHAGGFVGNHTSGTIEYSYAIGTVTGTATNKGGLVGTGSGTVTNSYFDSTVNPDLTAGTAGKITTDMQTPEDYTDIYSTWNIDTDNADSDDNLSTGVDDPWQFGTASQYPVLKVDFGGASGTADDVTAQRP